MSAAQVWSFSISAARLVHPLARGLGGAAHVVVARLLGLDPRLLHVRHQQGHPLDLAVEVVPPLGAGGEARAVGAQHVLEVPDDLVHLAQVMVDPRARLLDGLGQGQRGAATRGTQEKADGTC